MVLKYLRDLTRNTSSVKFAAIKVTGTNGEVSLEAASEDKTVILKGKFNDKISDFEGITGLGQLERLNALVNGYGEKDDTATVSRVKKKFMIEQKDSAGQTIMDDNGMPKMSEVEDEIVDVFTFSRADKNNNAKSTNKYRPMDRRMIPDQYKFTGQKWDITFEPTKGAIDLLQMQAGFGVGSTFSVKTADDKLFLTIGDAGEEGTIVFADGITGNITRNWTWPLTPVLSLLKLSDKNECTMSFLDKGALQITLKSAYAEYNFIMPAKAK